ncbi:MAG: riboflavin synthase [Gemmatales bacterium]|nr:riboflavin synthase [Gemmatales bacterium]MDW7993101.1 riboflavin synthase [Gemmatales bacterium]
MFTGIIQYLGTVSAIHDVGAGKRLVISHEALARPVGLGESLAVNGVCLTVVHLEEGRCHFDLGPETLSRTNLARLQVGDMVNLELPLRLGDTLGGHWVQGHVDGLATVLSRQHQEQFDLLWLGCSQELLAYMVPKGSIALDGVSLTLVEVHSDRFSVMLIPYTLAHTTLGVRRVGDLVNVELDILSKYVRRAVETLLPHFLARYST